MNSEIEYRQGQKIFIFRKYTDRLWGPLNLLLNEYWGYCTGIKLPGRDADHSPSFSAEINEWSKPHCQLYAFTAWKGTHLTHFMFKKCPI
jgi:hypothetical protein